VLGWSEVHQDLRTRSEVRSRGADRQGSDLAVVARDQRSRIGESAGADPEGAETAEDAAGSVREIGATGVQQGAGADEDRAAVGRECVGGEIQRAFRDIDIPVVDERCDVHVADVGRFDGASLAEDPGCAVGDGADIAAETAGPVQFEVTVVRECRATRERGDVAEHGHRTVVDPRP